MNLSVVDFNKSIKDMSNISSFEKKNLAILILVKHKLTIYTSIRKDDEFINELYSWLDSNIISYRELEILFTTYYNTKDGTNLKNKLFKMVKPIEEIAIYLKETAIINNKVGLGEITQDNILIVKAFALNLLDYWFNILEKQTYYYKNIYEFDYQDELEKLNKTNKDNSYGFINKSKNEFREQLNLIYDNSIEIAEFISNYAFKIIVPNIKGRKMSKKLLKENKKK